MDVLKKMTVKNWASIALGVVLAGVVFSLAFGSAFNAKAYEDGCDGSYAYMEDLTNAAPSHKWESGTDEDTHEAMMWSANYINENEPPEPIKGYMESLALILDTLGSGEGDTGFLFVIASSDDLERGEAKIHEQCSDHKLVTEYFND